MNTLLITQEELLARLTKAMSAAGANLSDPDTQALVENLSHLAFKVDESYVTNIEETRTEIIVAKRGGEHKRQIKVREIAKEVVVYGIVGGAIAWLSGGTVILGAVASAFFTHLLRRTLLPKAELLTVQDSAIVGAIMSCQFPNPARPKVELYPTSEELMTRVNAALPDEFRFESIRQISLRLEQLERNKVIKPKDGGWDFVEDYVETA